MSTKTANDEEIAVSDHSKKHEKKKRSREKHLIAVIVVLVVSWLIVKIWADVFDLFVRKVLKIKKKRFVANLIIAIFVTVIIIWLLYALDVDDMLST